jgi:hypothetical protein
VDIEEKRSLIERMRHFVFNRQRAYIHTFDLKSEVNQQVLSDLAKFCRAGESTFHTDPRVHAVLEGRREVWLRIQNHLKMDSETLYSLLERKGS